jgi:tetratricopeptide (TPR) repeat protein
MSTFQELLQQKKSSLQKRIDIIKENARDNWLRSLEKNGFEHSKSVENHLDRLVPDNIKEEFDPAEIFVLLCAVYLHDIGRLSGKVNHEKSSFDEIQKNFREYGLDDRYQAGAVAWVCYGHASEDECPLRVIDDRFGVAALGSKPLNLRFLAALLRLADEIDNCYIRVAGYPSHRESMRHLVKFVDIDLIHWSICFQTEPADSSEFKKLNAMQKSIQERLDKLIWVIEPRKLFYNRIELKPKPVKPDPQRYLQSVLQEYRTLRPLYVELTGQAQVEEDWLGIIEPELREYMRRARQKESLELVEKPYAVRQVRLKGLLELVDKPYDVMLIGETGSGKTTALRRIALQIAEESLELGTEGHIPILLSLSDLESADVEGWVRKRCNLLEPYLDNYIRSGRCIFLWDALDEMIYKDEEEYTKKIDALKQFMRDYSDNHFIWSCRRLDYRENLPLQHVEILPLSDEQIRQFFYNLEKTGGVDVYIALLRQLEADRARGGNLWELFRRPLMLELLYMIYIMNRQTGKSGSIPKNRASLFEEFVNILMMRKEKRGGALSHEYPPEVLKSELGKLAFAMMSAVDSVAGSSARSGTSIPIKSAHLYLPDAREEDLLDMAAASEVILEVTPDRLQVRFWHQSLQQYFAAKELERQLYSGEDLARIFKPHWSSEAWRSRCSGPLPMITGDWEETLTILAGICQKPDKLISSIMRENPILAGHCVIEGGAKISDRLLEELASDLVKVIERPEVDEANIALRVRLSAGYILENLDVEEPVIPLEKISDSLFKVFQEKQATDDYFWREMHTALHLSFGIYPRWPEFLRVCMEKIDDQKIMFFLGSVHDMEGRHNAAVNVFGKMLKNTGEDDPIRNSIIRRLAAALRHTGRQKEALEELSKLISVSKENGEPRETFCWDEYQRGITFRELRQYDESKEELESLYQYGRVKGLSTSALHHLGVIDLELGDLEQAANSFRECRKSREVHREAYEHRRLGQVCALEGRFEMAREEFDGAIEISSSYVDLRYVRETQRDITMFLKTPCHVIDKQPETIRLPQLLKQSCTNEWLLFRTDKYFSNALNSLKLPKDLRMEFEDNFASLPDDAIVSVMEKSKVWTVKAEHGREQYIIRLDGDGLGIYDRPRLEHAFRVVNGHGQVYLEIINPDSTKFSGEVMRQDICHSNGDWHASVTVLIMSGREEIALLLSDEDESRDKCYELIANHKAVLESDMLVVVREIRRKLGLTIGTQKLIRVGKPYEFKRIGKSQVNDDQNGSPARYIYRADGIDCECVSVFVLNLSESEKKQLGTAVEWISLSNAAGMARNNPAQFGIAFRQLFVHDCTANRIAKEIRKLGTEDAE